MVDVLVGTSALAFGQFITLNGASCLGTGRAVLSGTVKMGARRVGMPDVKLTLRGSDGCDDVTTMTDAGTYRFRQLAKGNYQVTPAKDRCLFDPSSQTVRLMTRHAKARFIGICP